MSSYSNSHQLAYANGDRGCAWGSACSTCGMNKRHRHWVRYRNNYSAVKLHVDHVSTSLHNLNIRSSCLTYYTQHTLAFLSHAHTHPSCFVTFSSEQGQGDTLPPIIITCRQCEDQLFAFKDPWTNS